MIPDVPKLIRLIRAHVTPEPRTNHLEQKPATKLHYNLFLMKHLTICSAWITGGNLIVLTMYIDEPMQK